MMKRLIYISVFLICIIGSMSAQDTDTINLYDRYLHITLDLCPMLSPQQRFELIENAKIGRFDTITNYLQGKSWIDSTNFTANHFTIHQTQNTSLELQVQDSQIIAIQTYYAPLPSSTLTIYDGYWTPIGKQSFTFPTCHDIPSVYIKATMQNDSILLENYTLDHIENIDKNKYTDCQRTLKIPMPR